MIPHTFNYKKAASVEDAIAAMGEDARVLSGGHSLIPTLKLRLDSPATLVDISKIEGLKEIKDNEKSITVGAGATHASIAANAALAEHAPVMTQAAHAIGDIQVRNVGTIGGSIAHADPSADWPAALLAVDANVVIQGASGKREVDIDQFFTGFYETALAEGEIITAIRVPKTAFNSRSAYVKFKQPASRFALVGCAVSCEMDGNTVKSVRVALTGVADHAYRAMSVEKALVGQELNEANISSAVASITEGVDVLSDHYASEKYRSAMAQVYAKRALKAVM